MNAVLYTHQLEPITVVDIPMWLWDRLWAGDHIALEVQVHAPFVPFADHDPMAMPQVVIHGERIQRGEHRSLMLFTHDEEHALMLRADFLPGQRAEVKSRERRAFVHGFLDALQRLQP